MKDEWKLFLGWVVIVSLLLLIEPLGTKHKYRKKPVVDKSYYCIIHEAPEVIYKVDSTLRVRRWSGYNWDD